MERRRRRFERRERERLRKIGERLKEIERIERRQDKDDERHLNYEYREEEKRKRRQDLKQLESKNFTRQVFDSLKSSVVQPNLGPLMAKNTHGFCKTINLPQTVSLIGCRSRTIPNKFCFGQCNSYYIPSDSNDTMPYTACAYCTPHRYRWIRVALYCPYFETASKDNEFNDDDENNHSNNNNDNDSSDNHNYNFNKFNRVVYDDDDHNKITTFNQDLRQMSTNQQQTIIKSAYRYKKVQVITKCRCQNT